MDAILSRLPSRDTLHRNRAAWAGFAAGALGTLVAALFVHVLITGYGIGETPLPPTVIYPNF